MWRSIFLVFLIGCSTAPPTPVSPTGVLYVPASKAQINPVLSIQWDSNIEPDLAGYKIYYSGHPGARSSGTIAAVMTPTVFPIDLTQTGDFYFQVTAFNGSGMESGPSNEVRLIVPKLSYEVVTDQLGVKKLHVFYFRLPPNPQLFYELQSSTDLVAWTTTQDFFVTPIPEADQERVDAYFLMDKPAEFFRVKISFYNQKI